MMHRLHFVRFKIRRLVPDGAARDRAETHRPGQAVVEFALLAPLVVLLIVGVFDLARAFLLNLTLQNAAREGARYAARYMVASATQAGYLAERVQEELESGGVLPVGAPPCDPQTGRPFICRIDSFGTEISYACSDYAFEDSYLCEPRSRITVSVVYAYQSIFSYVYPAVLDLRAQAQFQMP